MPARPPRCRTALVLGLLLAGGPSACGSDAVRGDDPGIEARRVSMALRGVPPSLGELTLVRQEPTALRALTDQWLADPRFAETVADWHAEMLWLRHDTEAPLPPRGPLEGEDRGAIGDSMAEAPLRSVVRLVREGASYRSLFEGRQVSVDARTAAVWGLPYEPGFGGWQTASLPAELPAAGILVDPNLWSRHISSDTNHHRARANLVHRVWLCEDLSARTLELGDLDLSDADAVTDAVRTDPGCVGCHETLDPLASAFAGWRRYITPSEVAAAYDAGCEDADFCYPLGLYAPASVPTAADLALPEPALAGRPVADLAELGQALVDDPRFGTCVARQMAAYLRQQSLSEVPSAEAERLGRRFVDSGHDLTVLAREIVLSDRFRAQGGEVGPLLARPEQVARTVADRTGFTWLGDPDAGSCPDHGCWGPVDLMTNARWGYREIAGGMDGYHSHQPVHQPQPLRHLAVGRLAEEAAGQVVGHEAGLPPSERRLLTRIELDDTDPERVQVQLQALHEALLGESPESTELPPLYALWSGAHQASGSTERAWAAVIAAMLQAPELRVY